MKRNFTLKLFIASICILFSIKAIEAASSIHIETAGTLPTLISEDQKYQITDLILSGELNGTDIRYIREMAGTDFYGKPTEGKLANLDMANVNIVEGGGSYCIGYWNSEYSVERNEIGNSMFMACKKLVSIILPHEAKAIADYAFVGCENLANVSIGDNTTSIGELAFRECKSLISIIIPDNVTDIDNSPFWACTSLTEIYIGKNVSKIFDNALGSYSCTSLTKIVVSEENSTFSSLDGVLFNKDKTTLIAYPIAKTDLSYIIPSSVTDIINSGFSGSENLTSITIPENVTNIGSLVFHPCNNLTEFIVSDQNPNYSDIDGVLFNKDKTTLIAYPIAKTDLSYIIPSSVTNIESFAFTYCKNLTEVIISEKVTHMGVDVFAYCTSLTNVIIGQNVTHIGTSAFYNCTSLTEVIIPESVIDINSHAFADCTNLSKVTIGKNVKYIDGNAFSNCTDLMQIHNNNPTPQNINQYHFYGVDKTTCKLYIPIGAYDAYKNAPGWQDFKNIIEEDTSSIGSVNKDKISISTMSDGIEINPDEILPVSIYNISGQKIYQSVVNGPTEIKLNKGIYIVNVKDQSHKVIVK